MNIAANGTVLCAKAPGELKRLVVSNAGTAWQLVIWDGPNGSGDVIATLNPPIAGGQYDFEGAEFGNGLSVVASGTTAGNATITWD